MNGLHLTADLKGCPATAAAMSDADTLRELCLREIRTAGLKAVGELFHRFPPAAGGHASGGVTGVVLLAESHLAVHTWPERGAVTLDVFVCNVDADNSECARQLMDRLVEAFGAGSATRHALRRGDIATLPETPSRSGH